MTHPATRLIHDVGLIRLAGTDGCMCMHCEVQHVSVDVSCRKSSGSSLPFEPKHSYILVRVYSSSMDIDGVILREVAQEVLSQLLDEPVVPTVRFCSYEEDKESRCLWCGASRRSPDGYYCEEHELDDPRELHA